MISSEDSKQQISTLTELGLSATQAKIYLALLKVRNQTAQSVSAISTVSRPDVYRVLNELQELGLVEKIIAKPEEFRAIPIEECVSILLQRRISKVHELQDKGIKLVQSVKQKLEAPEAYDEKRKSEFVFIPSKGTAYARTERMLRNIGSSIYFVGLTKRMSSWLAQYSTDMEKALERKIDCRMIMLDSECNPKLMVPFKVLQKYPNFIVKTMGGSPKATFSIWDRKEILITTSMGDIPFPSGTLWSSNSSLIELCADYFECLWQKAQEANAAKSKPEKT